MQQITTFDYVWKKSTGVYRSYTTRELTVFTETHLERSSEEAGVICWTSKNKTQQTIIESDHASINPISILISVLMQLIFTPVWSVLLYTAYRCMTCFPGHSEQCKVQNAGPALPSQASVKSRRRPADSSLAGALEERASARLKPPPCDRSWVAESRRSRAGRWQAEVGARWPEELMGKTEALESCVCETVFSCWEEILQIFWSA